mmetsp:Transcript_20763/g.20866  ORF Transcript_20763/g.20866 Transcript_20763/m.20866 type:complete len:106 (+) Transcript_20763:1480-1797(+)
MSYPLYYNNTSPHGKSNSGMYTCFKHNNLEPWTYHTGGGNRGVVAAVVSSNYSIGYSVLQEAKELSLSTVSIIHRAGNIVTAPCETVAFAVLEKGGNLDEHFNAD